MNCRLRRLVLATAIAAPALCLHAAAPPGETYTFTPNAAIPPGDPTGYTTAQPITSAINVLSDVQVTLKLTGDPNTYNTGDSYAYLRLNNPGGTGFTVLLNRTGQTAANPGGYTDTGGFDVTFSGSATNGDIHNYQNVTTPASGSALTGTWQPDGRNVDPATVTDMSPRTALLSSFNGLSANGTWTLFVADYFSGSQSTLASWGLNLTGLSGPFYWKGQTSGDWNAVGPAVFNWAADMGGMTPIRAIPNATSDVIFSASGATNQGTTKLNQDFTIQSLTDTDTAPVVIDAGTGGAHTLTIAGPAGTGITVGTGANLTLNANVNVTLGNSSDTIEVDGTGQATIKGVLGGANVNKTGTGTLFLAGANTFTGAAAINGGTVSISNAGAFSKGGVTLAAGTELNSTATLTLANLVNTSATGNSTISAATGSTLTLGSLSLEGGNAVFGSTGNTGAVVIGPRTGTFTDVTSSTIQVAFGTLRNGASGGNGLGTFTFNSASTTVNSGATLDVNDFNMEIANLAGTGSVTLGASGATLLAIDAGTFGGIISGSGGVQINSQGTVTLTGANSYLGGTEVTAGQLQLGNGTTANAALGTGAVTVDATTTLSVDLAAGETFSNPVINNGHLLVNSLSQAAFTVSGPISGLGELTKSGGNIVTVTGNNSYGGGTTIGSGTLLVNNTAGSGTGGGTVTIKSGAILGGSGTISGPIALQSGGNVTPGAGSPGVAGTILHGTSLTWDGGAAVNLQLGVTSDQLALTGALTKGLPGNYNLALSNSGITQSNYTLATFGSTTFAVGDFTLSLPPGYTGTLLETSTSLKLALAASVSGDTIQNAPPVLTPVIADFVVSGPVHTGRPSDNNTINSLIFTPGGTLAINNTLTLTSGRVTTGSGFNSIAGGNLAGPNGLFFNVNSEMAVASTLTGNTFKTGTGSLLLDGTLFGNLQVLQGLFGGNAFVLGNLYNASVVSPGHSPGSIVVSGNYTQAPAGLLKIEIGGRAPSQHDLLAVGGAADLDGTLQLVRLNNFTLRRREAITFLTANAGVVGQFATVLNGFRNDTILQPTVVYGPNSVSLQASQGSFAKFASDEGLTPNQTSVARALDKVAFRVHAPKLIDYLDTRPLAKLPRDLDRLAPEELTSIFTISTSLAKVQSLNLERRTDDLRSGASGFSAASFALSGTGPSYSGGLNKDAKETKKLKEVAPVDERVGVFLSGTGEWVHVGSTENARDYDLTSGGFTLGLDYKVCPNFAIGVMAGYTNTTADLTDRGRVWVNGGKLGLYATTFVDGWYADAAITGGYNSYDTRRGALLGAARGSTDGGELNALFGTGYDFKTGGLTFGPTATFNYTHTGTNDFTESGSLAPLQIRGGHGESLRTAVGLKASYDWKIGGLVIKPELRAAWQHEFGDDEYALQSSFAQGGSGTFVVHGPQTGRDSALLGAGFAIQVSERTSTYLYYDGELGRTNYHAASLTGGLRVAF